MQTYTPRPSLQPSARPHGSFRQTPGRPVVVPGRDTTQPANAVDRALMHHFESPAAPPGERYHAVSAQPPAMFANSTQALFAAPEQQTPYQQQYHYGRQKPYRPRQFPFRALMIVLVVGAMTFGAYAIYNAFTRPSAVNAEPKVQQAP